MSQENVELVRRIYDAGEHVISVVARGGRGRTSGVYVETRRAGVWTIRDDKVLRTVWDYFGPREWAHRDIEFGFADGPSPEGSVGVTGMAAGWREFLKAWGSHRTEPDESRELDDERVLVLVRAIAQGRTSGLDAAARGANLFHIRAGMVTKLVLYWDLDRALAELGLKE